MAPIVFEAIVFLKTNGDLLDKTDVIDAIISRQKCSIVHHMIAEDEEQLQDYID